MSDQRKFEDGPESKWVVPGSRWRCKHDGRVYTVEAPRNNGYFWVRYGDEGGEVLRHISVLLLPNVARGDAYAWQDLHNTVAIAEHASREYDGEEAYRLGVRAVFSPGNLAKALALREDKFEDGPESKWVVPGTVWESPLIGGPAMIERAPDDEGYCGYRGLWKNAGDRIHTGHIRDLRLPRATIGDVIVGDSTLGLSAFVLARDGNLSGADFHEAGWRAVVRGHTKAEALSLFAATKPEITQKMLWDGIADNAKEMLSRAAEVRPAGSSEVPGSKFEQPAIVGAKADDPYTSKAERDASEWIRRVRQPGVITPEDSVAHKRERDAIIAAWMDNRNASFRANEQQQLRQSVQQRLERQRQITDQTSGPMICRFGWGR